MERMERSSNSSRIKQRITRMFLESSLLRSSCTTTTTIVSTTTTTTTTSRSRNISNDKIEEPSPIPRRSQHHHSLSFASSDNDAAAPVLKLSIDCVPKKDKKKKKKRERRITETGVFYETGKGEGRTCPPASPASPSNNYYNYNYYHWFKQIAEEKKDKILVEKSKKKEKIKNDSFGFISSCSVESDDGFRLFSSEGEEEMEESKRLFSSRSFSSADSSEIYHCSSSNTINNKNKKEKKSTPQPPRRGGRNSNNNWITSDRYRPLVAISSMREVAAAEESAFAVVKRSRDPYGDFRSSMVEMIVERQMFRARDMEQLLHSYLSLNSSHHHSIIVEAFSDVWEALFGN